MNGSRSWSLWLILVAINQNNWDNKTWRENKKWSEDVWRRNQSPARLQHFKSTKQKSRRFILQDFNPRDRRIREDLQHHEDRNEVPNSKLREGSTHTKEMEVLLVSLPLQTVWLMSSKLEVPTFIPCWYEIAFSVWNYLRSLSFQHWITLGCLMIFKNHKLIRKFEFWLSSLRTINIPWIRIL